MARPSQKPVCSEEDKAILRRWSKSKTEEQRVVERAKILLISADGMSDAEIAQDLSLNRNTVRAWRFLSDGIGLKDLPRSGKPPTYDKEQTRIDIFIVLETPPPKGQATWDGKAVALELGISDDIVWKILRKEGSTFKERGLGASARLPNSPGGGRCGALPQPA